MLATGRSLLRTKVQQLVHIPPLLIMTFRRKRAERKAHVFGEGTLKQDYLILALPYLVFSLPNAFLAGQEADFLMFASRSTARGRPVKKKQASASNPASQQYSKRKSPFLSLHSSLSTPSFVSMSFGVILRVCHMLANDDLDSFRLQNQVQVCPELARDQTRGLLSFDDASMDF